jgi:hypothetical protein
MKQNTKLLLSVLWFLLFFGSLSALYCNSVILNWTGDKAAYLAMFMAFLGLVSILIVLAQILSLPTLLSKTVGIALFFALLFIVPVTMGLLTKLYCH